MSKNRDDIVLRDILNVAQLVAEIKTSEVLKLRRSVGGYATSQGDETQLIKMKNSTQIKSS